MVWENYSFPSNLVLLLAPPPVLTTARSSNLFEKEKYINSCFYIYSVTVLPEKSLFVIFAEMSANISPMEQRRDTPSSEDGSRSNRNSASKKANEEEEKSTAKNNRAKPADKGESSKADKQNKATEKSKVRDFFSFFDN